MQYDIYQAKSEALEEAGGRAFAGAKYFKPELFGLYRKVCEVDGRYCGLSDGDRDYTVTNKDEVFAILNGSYYDEDKEEDVVFDSHVSGYKMKTVTRKDGETITYRDMHSLSVGDIIAEVPQIGYETMTEEGQKAGTTYHIVDGFGFTDITDRLQEMDLASVRLANA